MAKFAVILPAAGQSSRFAGFRRKKPFVELKGRPVWVRTADHFVHRPDVCQTILVVAPDDLDWFREQFQANLAFMDITVVAGGASRAESVRNGITAINTDADYIAVHDAARPVLVPKWIDEVFAAAVKHGAAIPGLPVSSTVKKVSGDGTVESTVDRTSLVLAQTPQVCRRTILEKAFAACRHLSRMTDESSILELAGQKVHVVDGWPMNIKITTAEDFRMAEQFINATPKSDGLKNLHPFADERFL